MLPFQDYAGLRTRSRNRRAGPVTSPHYIRLGVPVQKRSREGRASQRSVGYGAGDGIQGHAVAPEAFTLVHELVGPLDERLEGVVRARQASSDRDGHAQLAPLLPEFAIGHRGAQLL